MAKTLFFVQPRVSQMNKKKRHITSEYKAKVAMVGLKEVNTFAEFVSA